MALFKRRSERNKAPESIVDQVLKDYANITSAESLSEKISSLRDDLLCTHKETNDLRKAISNAAHKLTLANGRVRKENYLYAKNMCESAKDHLQSLEKSEEVLTKAIDELSDLYAKINNMRKLEENVKIVENFNKISQGGSTDLKHMPLFELEAAVKRASYSMDAYLELKSN